MGSSAKPVRRRAAAPSLVRTPQKSRPRRGPSRNKSKDKDKFTAAGCGAVLGIIALVVLWILGGITWGETLWREVGQDWPGGGYGFGATAGALLPCALAATGMAVARINWRTQKVRSLGLGTLASGAAGAALAISFVAVAALPPKRRSSRADHWVHSHYPSVWLVGLLATVAATALLLWLYDISRRAAKSAVTSDASQPQP
ncbi:hypothetical protein ABZ208_26745 [Streptomyces sp. NPDC006208]|uniref:hypothetical protein n=1 Tax=Streptomyces sp. NPDC006208 TaxID=3156734 RepID=UPI0033B29203